MRAGPFSFPLQAAGASEPFPGELDGTGVEAGQRAGDELELSRRRLMLEPGPDRGRVRGHRPHPAAAQRTGSPSP